MSVEKLREIVKQSNVDEFKDYFRLVSDNDVREFVEQSCVKDLEGLVVMLEQLVMSYDDVLTLAHVKHSLHTYYFEPPRGEEFYKDFLKQYLNNVLRFIKKSPVMEKIF